MCKRADLSSRTRAPAHVFMESHISSFTHFPSWESINRWEDPGGTRPRIDSSLQTDPRVQCDWCGSSSWLLCISSSSLMSESHGRRSCRASARRLKTSWIKTFSKQEHAVPNRPWTGMIPQTFVPWRALTRTYKQHRGEVRRSLFYRYTNCCSEGALSRMLMLRSCVCRVQSCMFSQDPPLAS